MSATQAGDYSVLGGSFLVDVGQAKHAIREDVWSRLQAAHAARFPGARGRIPNFVGAAQAAALLAQCPEWRSAGVVKANPDSPQLPVRANALADGKRLLMAVPRLREMRPFVLIEPARLTVAPRRAASIGGAFQAGRLVDLAEVPRIDLVVCGSVTVNRDGSRIGKGGGFSDLEFGLLVEAGLVTDDTVIATTVHPLQIVEGPLPETEHDFRVDLIVTPGEVLRTPPRPRPRGIFWDHLDEEKIAAVPLLAERRAAVGAGHRAE